jgi:hypothetical protein
MVPVFVSSYLWPLSPTVHIQRARYAQSYRGRWRTCSRVLCHLMRCRSALATWPCHKDPAFIDCTLTALSGHSASHPHAKILWRGVKCSDADESVRRTHELLAADSGIQHHVCLCVPASRCRLVTQHGVDVRKASRCRWNPRIKIRSRVPRSAAAVLRTRVPPTACNCRRSLHAQRFFDHAVVDERRELGADACAAAIHACAPGLFLFRHIERVADKVRLLN